MASNNDDFSGDFTSSVLVFNASRNVTYYIAVDGVNGAAGNVQLNVFGATTGFTLYRTGFDNDEGFDTTVPLINQNGWASVDNITGGNGITANQIPNLDQAGFVGAGVSPGQLPTVLDRRRVHREFYDAGEVHRVR